MILEDAYNLLEECKEYYWLDGLDAWHVQGIITRLRYTGIHSRVAASGALLVMVGYATEDVRQRAKAILYGLQRSCSSSGARDSSLSCPRSLDTMVA
jgi:hypothetical protein